MDKIGLSILTCHDVVGKSVEAWTRVWISIALVTCQWNHGIMRSCEGYERDENWHNRCWYSLVACSSVQCNSCNAGMVLFLIDHHISSSNFTSESPSNCLALVCCPSRNNVSFSSLYAWSNIHKHHPLQRDAEVPPTLSPGCFPQWNAARHGVQKVTPQIYPNGTPMIQQKSHHNRLSQNT